MDAAPGWLWAIRRYLLASFAFHAAWEIMQLPLYTIYWTEPVAKQAFAIFHCTMGDGMIAGLSLLAALVVANDPQWPAESGRRVWLGAMIFGVGYTIFSEWLNVSVRGAWAYSEFMPTLPVIGTGVSPLLEWIVIPTLALWIAGKRRPWAAPSSSISSRAMRF